MIEKDYLPQYAAELVVDLEKSYEKNGHIAYRHAAEMVRNAAHIVLPMNGEIYRDIHLNISKEECVSTGVMPHVITTFEYPINDQYFLIRDSESIKPLFQDNPPEAIVTMIIDQKLNTDSPIPLSELAHKDSELGKRYPITLFNFTKFKTNPQNSPINWRLSAYYMMLLTPLVMTDYNGRQATEVNILNTFTREKVLEDNKFYTKEDLEAIKEKEGGIHPYSIISMHMAGMCAAIQACHSLRVGATLERRQDKSYTRSRTFQKKGVGGFEYHVLKLPHGTVKETLGSRCGGGERDGPRYHFRRAHLRNLSTGAQTFVRSCFVGNRDKGTVDKSYEVTKGEAA